MLVKENNSTFNANGYFKVESKAPIRRPIAHTMLHKKIKIVGILIISAFIILMSVKIFLLVFVIDPLVGTYGFISTFLVSMAFLFSFTKYKDPSLKNMRNPNFVPRVTIIIPSKNDGELIKSVAEAAIASTYSNTRIILVNDGSTDNTGTVMSELQKQYPEKVKAIDLPHNVGKRKAILTAIRSEKDIGDILVFIDSDSIIDKIAIEKIITCFQDPDVGAVTAHGRALNHDQNILTKIQDTWYDGTFFVMKGMESSFDSVTCCSGILSAYRMEAVFSALDLWANDTFLGAEFKPGDDRHLTSFVLGGNKHYIDKNEKIWKVLYCESAHVKTVVPSTFKDFVNQQIRWKKSWVRVFLFTAPFFFKNRSPILSLVYYLQMSLSVVAPIVSFRALVLLPIHGQWQYGILYFMGLMFISLMYGFTFKIRNPNTKNFWLHRILLTPLSIGMSWLLYYALLTIRKNSWLTR